jgi:hypothetical protein
MFVRYNRVDPRAEIEVLDASMLGAGTAYLARDGLIYQVQWKRMGEDQVLTLVDENGDPFPFKPGQTWIEVFALNSTVTQEGSAWRFQFLKDW